MKACRQDKETACHFVQNGWNAVQELLFVLP